MYFTFSKDDFGKLKATYFNLNKPLDQTAVLNIEQLSALGLSEFSISEDFYGNQIINGYSIPKKIADLLNLITDGKVHEFDDDEILIHINTEFGLVLIKPSITGPGQYVGFAKSNEDDSEIIKVIENNLTKNEELSVQGDDVYEINKPIYLIVNSVIHFNSELNPTPAKIEILSYVPSDDRSIEIHVTNKTKSLADSEFFGKSSYGHYKE